MHLASVLVGAEELGRIYTREHKNSGAQELGRELCTPESQVAVMQQQRIQDMDLFRRMRNREDFSRMGDEGGEGSSHPASQGNEDRVRVPEFPFFHHASMDNRSIFSASHDIPPSGYRSPSSLGGVESHFTHASSSPVNNISTPMEMLDPIGPSRLKDKGQSKGRKDKGSKQVEKASWNERKHAIFVRICLEQKLAGNKPTNALNKVGYENLEREFFRQTGTHYVRSQLKNHWDSTRRDWQIWKALGKQTGIGWDEVRKTYSQTSEWWENFGKTWPGAEKFASAPLAHEEELDALFLEGAALGDDTYIPSSGVIPPDDENANDVDVSVAMDDEHLSFDGIESPTQGGDREEGQGQRNIRKRRTPEVGGSSSKMKKKSRLSTGDKIEMAMQGVCEALKARNMAAMNTGSKEDPFSIEVVLDLLENIPGVERDTADWLATIRLMRDADNRRLFVALKTPQSRAFWLASELQKDTHP